MSESTSAGVGTRTRGDASLSQEGDDRAVTDGGTQGCLCGARADGYDAERDRAACRDCATGVATVTEGCIEYGLGPATDGGEVVKKSWAVEYFDHGEVSKDTVEGVSADVNPADGPLGSTSVTIYDADGDPEAHYGAVANLARVDGGESA